MQIAGIIAEYNPLHPGHLLQLEQTRQLLGPDQGVICAMSGNYVQRGSFALLGKHARAEAAVRSGADLVLELPLPWAVSSAEAFAEGGVGVLAATGLVTHLSFGSEHGGTAELEEVADCLLSPEYEAGLQRFLGEGMSFAACRQAVVRGLLGAEKASLLEQPNNILGIEYCKALRRTAPAIRPVTVRRVGAGHDSGDLSAEISSAGAIRRLLAAGQREEALARMAPAMAEIYRREETAGRGPADLQRVERAILARLRTMEREEFLALDSGREGLGNRLYAAAQEAASLEELLTAAKTKRYAHARLRRMVLWAWLGLTPADLPGSVPYIRVLAANGRGRELLAMMRKTAAVPVVTKPADGRKLPEEGRRLFALEARATDLYGLACPVIPPAGREWRESPVIL